MKGNKLKDKEKKVSRTFLVIVGIILVCVAITCFVLFMINGETKIKSTQSKNKYLERLVCESDNTTYTLFSYDNSVSKNLKITMTFNEKKLDTISLIYKLKYDDIDEVGKSESINHGKFNTTSQEDGLGPDAFGAVFSKLKETLQLSLYASDSDIDSKALKYFMLDNLASASYNLEKITDVYANLGLNCNKTLIKE